MQAIIIGATGLVGKALVKQLINDDTFTALKIFTRRTLGLNNPKIKEFIVDFENIEAFADKITGDVLFSTMGTTIKKAGSKAVQYKVDYTFQYNIAEKAAQNNVPNYVLVSSGGANAKSNFFYAKIKGELDEAVSKLNFNKVVILRPSVLLGNRGENRFWETIGMKVLSGIKNIPIIKKYKGIKDHEVADAMIYLTKNPRENKVSIYEYDEIFEFT